MNSKISLTFLVVFAITLLSSIQESNACTQISTACKQAYINAVINTINGYRLKHKVSPVKLTTNQTLLNMIQNKTCDLADRWIQNDRYSGANWFNNWPSIFNLSLITAEQCAGRIY